MQPCEFLVLAASWEHPKTVPMWNITVTRFLVNQTRPMCSRENTAPQSQSPCLLAYLPACRPACLPSGPVLGLYIALGSEVQCRYDLSCQLFKRAVLAHPLPHLQVGESLRGAGSAQRKARTPKESATPRHETKAKEQAWRQPLTLGTTVWVPCSEGPRTHTCSLITPALSLKCSLRGKRAAPSWVNESLPVSSRAYGPLPGAACERQPLQGWPLHPALQHAPTRMAHLTASSKPAGGRCRWPRMATWRVCRRMLRLYPWLSLRPL